MAMRLAEVRNRAAFASARKRLMPPSAVRYAFSPSKISCA